MLRSFSIKYMICNIIAILKNPSFVLCQNFATNLRHCTVSTAFATPFVERSSILSSLFLDGRVTITLFGHNENILDFLRQDIDKDSWIPDSHVVPSFPNKRDIIKDTCLIVHI